MFDDFVEDCGRQNDWTDSTYEKFAAVKNHLINFRERLTFEFFDERGLNDYVIYLRDIKDLYAKLIIEVMNALTKLHLNMPCLEHTLVVERLSVMRLHWVFLRK